LIIPISLLCLVGMTAYVMHLVYLHKGQISCTVAMMVAMAAAMMSSLLLGTVLGIQFFGRLFLPTEWSVLIGMMVGYLLGQPIHLMAALDGVMAGVMGGMMGAMLGAMVVHEAPKLTVGLVTAIFMFVMLLTVQLIKEETVERVNRRSQRRISWNILLFASILLVLVISFAFQKFPFFSVIQSQKGALLEKGDLVELAEDPLHKK
jgi:hypothetical protein